MTQLLQELNLMPKADDFKLAMRVMNSAAHSDDLDNTAAQEAFDVGKKFLAEVQKLIDS